MVFPLSTVHISCTVTGVWGWSPHINLGVHTMSKSTVKSVPVSLTKSTLPTGVTVPTLTPGQVTTVLGLQSTTPVITGHSRNPSGHGQFSCVNLSGWGFLVTRHGSHVLVRNSSSGTQSWSLFSVTVNGSNVSLSYLMSGSSQGHLLNIITNQFVTGQ